MIFGIEFIEWMAGSALWILYSLDLTPKILKNLPKFLVQQIVHLKVSQGSCGTWKAFEELIGKNFLILKSLDSCQYQQFFYVRKLWNV